MNRITSGWELVLMLGAGTGLVYILRWYWWRINAWSEIAAMAAALAPSFVNWILGVAVVYSTLFALGQMLFGTWPAGFGLAGVALVAGVLLSRRLE